MKKQIVSVSVKFGRENCKFSKRFRIPLRGIRKYLVQKQIP